MTTLATCAALGIPTLLAAAERERDAAREQVKRVRARHSEQCGGGCNATPCECAPSDLVCAECETTYPCGTRRDLDGTTREGTS